MNLKLLEKNLKITSITVTIPNGSLTASTAHGLSYIPEIVGRPNPNKLDGATSTIIATADAINITVECDAPVSSDIDFTVSIRKE